MRDAATDDLERSERSLLEGEPKRERQPREVTLCLGDLRRIHYDRDLLQWHCGERHIETVRPNPFK